MKYPAENDYYLLTAADGLPRRQYSRVRFPGTPQMRFSGETGRRLWIEIAPGVSMLYKRKCACSRSHTHTHTLTLTHIETHVYA